MNRARWIALVGIVGTAVSGCSSTTNPPPATPSVSVSPATANVLQGGTQTFTANVSGSQNTAVSWAVQENGGGTIDSTGRYTAPNAAGTFHVVATSSADSSKTASATVTVPAVAITQSPTSISLGFGTSHTFSASVTGTVNTAVTWSISGGPVPGAISANGAFTAPYAVGSYTIVATSSADPTKSASSAVTVAEVVSPPTVVDSSGGQVCTPGGVCVDIPAGALTQATTITISEAVAPAPVGVSPLTPLHRFQPEGTVFYVPVTVSIPVPTSTTAASLAWTKRGFVDYGAATTSDLDTLDGTVSGGKVSARVLHFSGGAATAPAPTRTVFGIFGKFHHPPGTPLAFAPVDLSVPPEAVFADTVVSAATTRYTGTGYADGLFFVPGLPSSGLYRMFLGSGGYEWTSLDPLARTAFAPGRADAEPWDLSNSAPANLSLALSGLAPWKTGDYIELASPGAYAYLPGLPPPTPAADATTYSGTLDLKAMGAFVPNTLEGSKGDRLVILQEEVRPTANGETYWTVVSSLIASPFDLTGPGTVSIAAPLQPLALTHSLDCDFRISQFASAVQTSLPLNLASGSVIDPSGSSYLAVLGNFGPLEEGILFNNADLLSYAHATDDSDVATGAMAYGTPAPDQLQPFGFVRYSKSVRFLLPGTTPPRAVFVAGMDQTLDATSLCTGAVIPVLEPVSNLEVAGMDARQPLQGVGLAPTISWTPPAVGTPVRYTVTINLLSATTANNTTSSSVASIVTSQTQVPVPSGLLESGKIYVISIITEVALTGVTSGTSSYSVSNTITP